MTKEEFLEKLRTEESEGSDIEQAILNSNSDTGWGKVARGSRRHTVAVQVVGGPNVFPLQLVARYCSIHFVICSSLAVQPQPSLEAAQLSKQWL